MKKIIAFLALCSMVLLFSPIKALAGPSVDQQYTEGSGNIQIPQNGRTAQSFKPQYANLSKVEVDLAAPASTANLTCSIEKYGPEGWGSVAACGTKTAEVGWNVFDFDDFAVDNGGGARYRIRIDATYTGQAPLWKYGTATPYGPYDKGIATWNGEDKDTWDFNFKTWGTNPVEIVDENTQATDPSDAVVSDGQTTGTGGAPATTTSAAIKAATGLKAEYANSAVNLSWTASVTSDIDGYKVFRSETKTTGFTEIGKTIKATLAYVDSKDLVAEKTYYYMVRAYKGIAESASTSIVTIEIPATTAETAKTKTLPFFADLTDTTDWSQIQLYWILGGIIGVLIALLIVHERERARTLKLLSGRHFRLDK